MTDRNLQLDKKRRFMETNSANKQFRKVEFAEYSGKYDKPVGEMLHTSPESISIEDLRAYIYGYTYTDEYAKGIFPDEMSMDYWRDNYDEAIPDEIISPDDKYSVDTVQERCILKAIDSTGDGKTINTALCVIAVGQEYEYLSRVSPYDMLEVAKQKLCCDTYDCLGFKENPFGIERIYFDIHRRFEVGYPRK